MTYCCVPSMLTLTAVIHIWQHHEQPRSAITSGAMHPSRGKQHLVEPVACSCSMTAYALLSLTWTWGDPVSLFWCELQCHTPATASRNMSREANHGATMVLFALFLHCSVTSLTLAVHDLQRLRCRLTAASVTGHCCKATQYAVSSAF